MDGWMDGSVTEKASMMLKELSSSLGISDEAHKRLEKEVIGDHYKE